VACCRKYLSRLPRTCTAEHCCYPIKQVKLSTCFRVEP